MIRKAILYIVILAALTAIVTIYIEVKQAGTEVSSALQAVSPDAALIWENAAPIETWNKIANNSVIWEELKLLKPISEADTLFRYIDTSIISNSLLKELHAKEHSYLVIEKNGDRYDFIWLMKYGANYSTSSVESAFDDIFNCVSIGEERLKIDISGKNYYAGFSNNLIAVAGDSAVINAAVKRSQGEVSILSDSSFTQLYATRGKVDHGHVYINHREASNTTKHLLIEDLSAMYLDPSRLLGESSFYDVSLKSNVWMLNGFTQSGARANDYLSLFKDQRPHEHDAITVLPESTAGFVHLGFSNFSAWYKEYRKHLSLTDRLFAHDSTFQAIDELHGIKSQNSILSWIEHEIVVGYRNDPVLADEERYYAIMKTSNESKARQELRKTHGDDAEELSYNEFEIGRVGIDRLLENSLGRLTAPLRTPYYTMIGRYVIFSNSEKSIKRLINDYLAGRTLIKNENFKKFNRYVSNESNVFLYFNPAYYGDFAESILNESAADFIVKNDSLLKKFGGVSIQWSSEKDRLFYSTVNLMHNPLFKEQPHSLWELALDTGSSAKPAVVKNHNTGAKEVFIQDDAGQVYLISNTGRILWKKQLDGPILSEIYQIDRYANNKLQLLFNTGNKLYLIDRLGNHVEGYPVRLSSKASTGLSLFDYNNDGEYRIFIPMKNGDLANFDKKGEAIKGWKFEPLKSSVIHPVSHHVIKRKDYLIAVCADGSVRGFSRRGQERLKFEETLPVHQTSSFFTETNSTLDESFIVTADSLGLINKLYFNGNLERKELGEFYGQNRFLFADINTDGVNDYLIADSAGLKVYDNGKNLIFEYEYVQSRPAAINTYVFQNTIAAGISFAADNQILLINRTGELWPGFPLRGNGPFSVTDLNNDGTYNLQVVDNSGILYSYLIRDGS